MEATDRRSPPGLPLLELPFPPGLLLLELPFLLSKRADEGGWRHLGAGGGSRRELPASRRDVRRKECIEAFI